MFAPAYYVARPFLGAAVVPYKSSGFFNLKGTPPFWNFTLACNYTVFFSKNKLVGTGDLYYRAKKGSKSYDEL